MERRDSTRTQVSICSVWTVDEVGQKEQTELEKGAVSPPDQILPPRSGSSVESGIETVRENIDAI